MMPLRTNRVLIVIRLNMILNRTSQKKSPHMLGKQRPRTYRNLPRRKITRKIPNYRTMNKRAHEAKTKQNPARAVYAFTSEIHRAIEETQLYARNELQLTNAIQRLIDNDFGVYSSELNPYV
jgi:hypothetical protein